MSPTPNKSIFNTEREWEIERLRLQVADAEQHGQFDTAHHQMLKRLEALKASETIKGTKEKDNGE